MPTGCLRFIVMELIGGDDLAGLALDRIRVERVGALRGARAVGDGAGTGFGFERDAGGEFKAGLPVRLFDGPLSVEDDGDVFFRQPTLVAIDGERFLFQVPDEELRDRTIEVVMNWERLLER